MEQPEITWSDDLLVGHTKVDKQHKRLVGMIAEFPLSEEFDDNKVFEAILIYARTHFTEEEQLMREAAYPGLEEHCHTHQRLLKVLAFHRRKFLKGKMDPWNFRDFMRRWIWDHIMDSDQEFATFLRREAA